MVRLPEALAGSTWKDVLGGKDVEVGQDGFTLDALLASVAAAVLVAPK